MDKIAFTYTSGRKNRLEAVAKKESPDDFFYGGLELQRRGYDVTFLEDADFTPVPLSIFKKFVGRISRLVGIDAVLFFRFSNKKNLGVLNAFDIVVATGNAQGIVFGLLRLLGKLKPKVIFISGCPLFPEDNFLKKYIYRPVLRQMILAIENKHEIIFLNKLFGANAPVMAFVPFGVDGNFWHPAPAAAKQPAYVLSMGNDTTRDFETLVQAWQPSYPDLRIITRLAIKTPLPANVSVIQGDWNKQYLSDEKIREYIQGSLWMVIPTRESLRSSGPSVAMQSMACGKLVMLTKNQGLWDTDVLRDRETCILSEPASVESLSKNIELLLNDSALADRITANARPTMEQYYTVSRYADDIEKLIK